MNERLTADRDALAELIERVQKDHLGHRPYERAADAIIAAGWIYDGSCRDCQASNGMHYEWCSNPD